MRKKKKRRSKKKSKPSPREITIKAFFSWLVNLNKIEKFREAELLAFFKKEKLKDKDYKDTYLKAFEKYLSS